MPGPDTRPDPRPTDPRQDRQGRQAARKLGLALTVLGLLASLLALMPASPAQAQAARRPILIVGGFSQQQGLTEIFWANQLASYFGMDPDLVEATELSGLFLPGTGSMEESADEILWDILALYNHPDNQGDLPVDIIGVSQGSPAARRTLQKYPWLHQDGIVDGFISLSGANFGIPLNHPDPQWTPWLQACSTGGVVWEVCEEMVYTTGAGQTVWLRQLNGIQPPGDPTPGAVDYYYIYSERTLDEQDEGVTAYGWTQPLPGAVDNQSAQDACPDNPNRYAPHAAWYPDGSDADSWYDPDPVMSELVVDALNRVSLVVEDQSRCADHADWPSDRAA